MAIALFVRGTALWLGHSDLGDDPDAYMRLAANWSRSGVFGFEASDGLVQPTAYRPPLYPWLLSWLASDASKQPTVPIIYVAMLHLLLGLATVAVTWSIASHLSTASRGIASLLVACDPILIRASQLVMTETLAALLALTAWKLWLIVYPASASSSLASQRGSCSSENLNCSLGSTRQCGISSCESARSIFQHVCLIGLGFSFGLSVLARPTAAPWVLLCVVGIFFLSSSCWKRRLNDSLIVSLLVVACLAPWVLRNMAVFAKPIWATTHGGYTLLLANNPLLFQHFVEHGPSRDWDAEPFHARWAKRLDSEQTLKPTDERFWFAELESSGQQVAMQELADDQLAYHAARETIARHPWLFGLSMLYRVGWLWAPWPNAGPLVARLGIGCWYAALFVAAILGSRRMVGFTGMRRWLRNWWLPWMLLISLTLIHSVYWSNMRMRAPVCAMLAIAASAASAASAALRTSRNASNAPVE